MFEKQYFWKKYSIKFLSQVKKKGERKIETGDKALFPDQRVR